MPITEVPVKTNNGFHGKRENVISIVHLVVNSYGPVYSEKRKAKRRVTSDRDLNQACHLHSKEK